MTGVRILTTILQQLHHEDPPHHIVSQISLNRNPLGAESNSSCPNALNIWRQGASLVQKYIIILDFVGYTPLKVRFFNIPQL